MQQITDNVCPICGTIKELIPAGISKRTGKPYDEFWSCPNRCKKPSVPANYSNQPKDYSNVSVDYSSKQVEDVKIVDKDSFLITEFVALREKVEELIKVIKSETNL